VKIALATDASLFGMLEDAAAALKDGERAVLLPIVRRAIEAKIRIVRDDEHEAGARALLNLGHTVGHALEAQGAYARHLHGEAVAIGTVLELRACAALGHSPPELAARTRDLLARLGLPVDAPPEQVAAAWAFVAADKKRTRGSIRLPVVTDVGRSHLESVPLSSLKDAVLRT
jgi:shikimate kinase/3-dehydroquinate synthase